MIEDAKKSYSLKNYKQAKIPAVGEKKNILYHSHLSSIVIDHLKKFASEGEMDRGLGNVPRNNSDTNKKIMNSLILTRKEGDDGKYVLGQTKYIIILKRMCFRNGMLIYIHFSTHQH